MKITKTSERTAPDYACSASFCKNDAKFSVPVVPGIKKAGEKYYCEEHYEEFRPRGELDEIQSYLLDHYREVNKNLSPKQVVEELIRMVSF